MNNLFKSFPNSLATLFIVLAFAYFFTVTIHPPDQAALAFVGDIKQSMLTMMGIVLGYFYGAMHKKPDNILPGSTTTEINATITQKDKEDGSNKVG